MIFVVRTTLERELHSSFDQIKFKLLIDRDHKIKEIFIDQLRSICNDDVVLMEDDIILCRNFENKVKEIIDQRPNEIINFFSIPDKYYKSDYRQFVYNQCTYYPKDILIDIVRFYDRSGMKGILLYPEQFIQRYLRFKKVYTPRPTLVQHIDNKSILDKRPVPIPRRTPYFIDYLEDLGISYEEAGTEENTKRLKEYMEEQFGNTEKECNIVLHE